MKGSREEGIKEGRGGMTHIDLRSGSSEGNSGRRRAVTLESTSTFLPWTVVLPGLKTTIWPCSNTLTTVASFVFETSVPDPARLEH